MYVKSKEGRPILTYLLIAALVITMLHMTFIDSDASDTVYSEYALRPSYITQGMRLLSIVTYMFLHSDWIQLAVNCFALFLVGSTIEKEIGSARFGIVYVASGVISGLVYVVLKPTSSVYFLGASGAIFGTLAVFLLLDTFKKTTLLLVPLPRLLIGLLAASIEVAYLIWSGSSTRVNEAHLAGFVTGALLAFWIDFKGALKGLAIGASVAFIIYLLGLLLDVI